MITEPGEGTAFTLALPPRAAPNQRQDLPLQVSNSETRL
jgi:hypothetical protein